MRRLGVRYRKFATTQPAQPVSGEDIIAIYDVDTGEEFDAVSRVTVDYPADGVVKATIEIFLQAVDVKYEPATNRGR